MYSISHIAYNNLELYNTNKNELTTKPSSSGLLSRNKPSKKETDKVYSQIDTVVEVVQDIRTVRE